MVYYGNAKSNELGTSDIHQFLIFDYENEVTKAEDTSILDFLKYVIFFSQKSRAHVYFVVSLCCTQEETIPKFQVKRGKADHMFLAPVSRPKITLHHC